MTLMDQDSNPRQIQVYEDLDDFSVIQSLKLAISKTFSRDFIQLVWPAFIAVFAISLINFNAGQFCNFFATIAVTVGWINYLNFAEPLQLSFKQRELRLAAWTIGIGFFAGMAMMIFILLASLFLKAGVPQIIIYGLGFLITTIGLWLYPFVAIFISLIALDYPTQDIIEHVKKVVRPVHAQLFGGYFFLVLLKLFGTLAMTFIFASLFGEDFSEGFILKLIFTSTFFLTHFLGEGITTAFTSHVLFTRALLTQ